MPKRPDDPVPNLHRAKELRAAQTPPEIVFWSRVRAHRLHGLKFKRQHPIGPYIADFYCAQAKLVVELDGRTHDHNAHAIWLATPGCTNADCSSSGYRCHCSRRIRTRLLAAWDASRSNE